MILAGSGQIRRRRRERAQAEAVLRDSQARLQRAESVAHFGNWTFDLTNRSVDVSPGARLIYGLQGEAWSIAEVQSIPLPEYRPALDAALSNLIEHHQPYDLEFRIRRPSDGQLRDIHSIAEYDPERRIVLGVIHDITARKQIETALQISLTKYQTLFDALPLGVTVADRTGRIIESNQAAVQILGLPKEGRTQRQIDDPDRHIIRPDGALIPPEEFAGARALKEQRQVSNVEMGLVKSPGAITWISATAAPLALEEQGVIVAYMDITEAKQAEAALRQSEARWHTIINASPDGICIASLDGVIQFVSDKLLTLHRYRQPADMLGRNLFEFLAADYHEPAVTRIQNLLNGQYSGVMEYKVIKCDGSTFFADINAEVLRDAAGQPANLLLIERDVTARKQAEAALRESEEKFRAMANLLPQIVFESDVQGRLTYVNQQALRILGYPEDYAIAGFNTLDLYVPEDRVRAVNNIKRRMAGLLEDSHEYTMIRYDGSLINVLVYSNPIVKDNRPAGLRGIIVDITERKQAEAALRRQNEYLAALQETTFELSAQLDLNRLFENIVTRAAALVGAAGGFLDMVDPTTHQLLPRVGAGVLAESLHLIVQPGEGVAGIVWQTGQPLVVNDYDQWANRISGFSRGKLGALIGVPLLNNGQILGVLGLAYAFNSGQSFGPEVVDILTQFARLAAIAIENARLVEAERARHRELEAVYEASRQLTQSLDVTTVLDAVLRAVLQLLPADNIHMYLYDGEQLSFGSAMSQQGQKIAPFAQPRPNGLLYTTARSGESIFVEDALHHPRFNAGASFDPPQLGIAALALKVESIVVGVMQVNYRRPHHFDEAEQRALELLAAQAATAIQHARLHQQVRDHAQQLEQRVAERTAELQAANRRLTELDHLKDEFLSRTSHELRTPLSSIKIYIELLETAKPEKRAKYLQTLKQEANRLHVLIEEVLLFSQLNLYTKPSTLNPIDVNNLIEGRLTTWQRLCDEHDLRLQLALATDVPHIRADGDLFVQALTRLMVNATSYTLTGSVTLSTALQVEADQRWVTIRVTDTGPGITPDDLPHIFERFYRGRAAADYKTPGVGVGLSISREIAEKLGGRLTVETQVGTGSTFTLWLPVTA